VPKNRIASDTVSWLVLREFFHFVVVNAQSKCDKMSLAVSVCRSCSQGLAVEGGRLGALPKNSESRFDLF
jgi:hypothetical protein